MINIIRKYNLKQIRLIITGVFALLFVTFVFFYFLFLLKIQKTEKYNTDFYRLQTYYYQLTNLKKEVLIRKNFDESFYNSTPETYLSDFIEIYSSFSETTENINQNKRTKKYGFQPQIKKISEDITSYYKKIVNIISLEQNIGNESYGIKKNLYIAKNDILKIIEEETLDVQLEKQIQNLFDLENSFLITLDEDYYNQFEILSKEVLSYSIFTDSTNVYDKYLITKISDLFSEYKNNFYLIVEKNVEIGLSETEGIYGELADLENILFENIKSLISNNDIKNKLNLVKIIFFAILSVISFIIMIFTILLLMFDYFNKNISKIKDNILTLATGTASDNSVFGADDFVFGIISESMQQINNGFKNKFDFANKIKNKEFDAELKLLSNNDLLGKSLIDLKESLRFSEQEAQRLKKADDIQDWKTLGLAKFGEVMRKNTDNLQQLSHEVIKNLIEYIDAAQGGFYIYNDENQNNIFLDLTAFYAYGKEKIAHKQIQLNEGLIGTCAVEKTKFYFKKIPDQYVYIASGFGQAKPESLIIMPLTVDKNVYGVIELASTRELYDYEIDFLDKLAVDIAITVSYVKINDETARFLKMSERQTRKLLRKQHDYDESIAKLEQDLSVANKGLIKKEQILKLKDELIAEKVRENKKINFEIKDKETYIEKLSADLKTIQQKLEELTKSSIKEKTDFHNKIRILESEIQRFKDNKEDIN